MSALLDALGSVADLKLENYRLWLSVSTLTEALIQRGLFTRDELATLASQLAASDAAAVPLAGAVPLTQNSPSFSAIPAADGPIGPAAETAAEASRGPSAAGVPASK